MAGFPEGWNERVLTRKDFYTACAADGVLVREAQMPLRVKGFYTVCEGVPVIMLNRALHGVERIIVGWHELGHHTLHSPGQSRFCTGTISKLEYEAQRFAACALIPLPILSSMRLQDLEEEFDYPADFVRFRCKVYRNSGF